MHQDSDAHNQDQIIHNVRVCNLHISEEFVAFLVMTVGDYFLWIFTFQIHPIEAVYRKEKTVESSSEIGDVENPAKSSWCVHVADAKTEDRKEDSDDRTSENCDLEIKEKYY